MTTTTDHWTALEDARLARRHELCYHDEGFCQDGPEGLRLAQGGDDLEV